MTLTASGTFEVDVQPETIGGGVVNEVPGRFTLAKRFAGDLVATGSGRMLAARSAVPGSAGYVAIERIEGTLHGKAGSFVVQHFGTLARGEPRQIVEVVPDSGSGELVGIVGTFAIRIDGKAHSYNFDYTLPDAEGPLPA